MDEILKLIESVSEGFPYYFYHENAKNNSKPSKFKTILFRLNSNCKKTIRNIFRVQKDLFTKIYIL